MNSISNTVRDLTIAAAALWTGAALPAAEPPKGETQARQSAEREPATPKEWTSSLVYKEIGAVEARISSIDQFFKDHPDQKKEVANWREKTRVEVERFAKEADKMMEGAPSPELLRHMGTGLAAVNATLASLLSSLSQQHTPARQGAAADGILGVYDVGDMEGMKTSAAIFRVLLQGQHVRNGTTPDATQQMILKGLEQIESAQNPRDLAEKLRPTATELISGLADQQGTGAKGLRESLKRMLPQNSSTRAGGFGGNATPSKEAGTSDQPEKGLRPIKGGFGGGVPEMSRNGAARSASPSGEATKPVKGGIVSGQPPTSETTKEDPAIAWKTAWEERIKGSTQLNRFARESNSFRDLVLDPSGMELVQKSAAKLIDAVEKSDPELARRLKTIATATDAEGILKPGFHPHETMRMATQAYERAGANKVGERK